MAPTDPSDLLAHATWLRRLAHNLVHEAADDVVQDTWVAASQFDRAGSYALVVGFFTGRAPDWVNLPISAAPPGTEQQHGVQIADVVVE